MVTYLLLRDNKESGPYTLEDLRAKGLKAYDLVWIEGKSAAWRYPSEIEELKPFAPIVEEQPYDRFFKKPAATAAASVNTNASISTSYPSVIAAEPSVIPGKRIIYVTLPAGSKSGVLRESVGTEITVPPTVTESRGTDHLSLAINNIVSDTRATGQPDSLPVPLTSNSEYKPKSEYKLSRFAEPESPAVELLPHSPGSRSRRLLRPLGIAVGVLALLAAGVFIGLSINRDHLFDFTQRTATKESPVREAQQLADNTAPASPANTLSTQAASQNTPNHPNTAAQVIAPAANISSNSAGSPTTISPDKGSAFAPEQPLTNSVTKTSVMSATAAKDGISADKPKKQPAQTVSAEQKTLAAPLPSPVKDSVSLNIPAAAHREAIHRTDASAEKDAFRTNIASLVSVSANTYNVGTFGGISDLQLTVNNRSAFPLDLVVVEVQYVQANKKLFKTETLSFHDIRAGSALMLEAPKTSRGIKVQYKVTLISSKELGLSYSAI